MRSWLLDLPLFIQLIAIGAVAMYVPAVMAFAPKASSFRFGIVKHNSANGATDALPTNR